MRTDPSDNGGLFVGRRPGTAPLRFRSLPQRGSEARQHVDRLLAHGIFLAMVLGSLLCWGPIPIACLWVGSEVTYLTGGVFLGIVLAIVALFVLLFGALVLLRRLDSAWILVRRAAGYDQRSGALGRIFALTAAVCAAVFSFWFIVIHGPGSNITPGGNKP
jgi:uncharacterized membrane protein